MNPSRLASATVLVLAGMAGLHSILQQSTTSTKAISGRLESRPAHPVPELYFEPNLGQTDPDVRFLVRGSGSAASLTSRGVAISSGRRAVRLELAGANLRPQIQGIDLLPGKSNSFIGNDPAKWRTGIPHYCRVRYRAVYPGTDVVFYSCGSKLEFDIVLAPGADPKQLAMAVHRAGDVRLDLQFDRHQAVQSAVEKQQVQLKVASTNL